MNRPASETKEEVTNNFLSILNDKYIYAGKKIKCNKRLINSRIFNRGQLGLRAF